MLSSLNEKYQGMGKLLLGGKMDKKQFIEMLESNNPIIKVPLQKACKSARKMKRKLSKIATTHGINADTAVQCILREALGSENSSCKILEQWRDPNKRPAFVTDELVEMIEEGLGVVRQTAKQLLSRVSLTPDEIVLIVCDKCKLC